MNKIITAMAAGLLVLSACDSPETPVANNYSQPDTNWQNNIDPETGCPSNMPPRKCEEIKNNSNGDNF